MTEYNPEKVIHSAIGFDMMAKYLHLSDAGIVPTLIAVDGDNAFVQKIQGQRFAAYLDSVVNTFEKNLMMTTYMMFHAGYQTRYINNAGIMHNHNHTNNSIITLVDDSLESTKTLPGPKLYRIDFDCARMGGILYGPDEAGIDGDEFLESVRGWLKTNNLESNYESLQEMFMVGIRIADKKQILHEKIESDFFKRYKAKEFSMDNSQVQKKLRGE